MKKFIESLFNWRQQSCSDITTRWAVFPSSWSNDKIWSFIEWSENRYYRNGFFTGFHNGSSYGGCGQSYCEEPTIRRSKTRVLLTQTYGTDI